MINCIVAIDKNQGIGLNNSLPWNRLNGDMAFFKKVTTNNVVIMGANTWKSLPGKLKNRINVVISRFPHDDADHCFSAIEAALVFCQIEYKDKDIFIIGGQQLYDATMDIIDRFYITEVHAEYNCDTFFNYNFVKNNFTKKTVLLNQNEDVQYTISEYLK